MEDKLYKAILELSKVHDKRFGEIAEALRGLAVEVKYLGTGSAGSGGMGAIEVLGMKVHEGLEMISASVAEIERRG